RAGAIAAYRAGARAAARVTEDRQQAAGNAPANLSKGAPGASAGDAREDAVGILPPRRPEPTASEPGPAELDAPEPGAHASGLTASGAHASGPHASGPTTPG